MKTTLFAAALLAVYGASAVRAGIFPPHAFTDEARGTAAAQFLKSPASARFSALGSGASALKAPDAFFYNPGGAAYIPEGSGAVMLGYESLLQDAGRGAAAWLKGLGRGVVGAGAVYRSDAGLRRYDDFGEPAGSFDAYDAAVAGYYGARTGPADAGIAVKYVRSRLADRSAGSVAADIGVVLNEKSPNGMRVAMYARNLGSPMKLGSKRAPLPAEFGAGMGWNYVPRLGLFVDGRMPSDHSPYFILSGEYAVPFDGGSGLFLRSGLNFKNSDDLGIMGVFSCGFGLRLRGIGFDYAFVPYGDLGVTHRLTLSRGFGPGIFTAASRRSRIAAGGDGKLSLAVAVLEPDAKVSEVMARQITDMLESELIKTGEFRLLERTRGEYVAAEKKLFYSGLGNSERSLELARKLGARGVVYGEVARVGRGYLISVKLALASTGEILAAESRTAEDDFLLPGTARELAAALSG